MGWDPGADIWAGLKDIWGATGGALGRKSSEPYNIAGNGARDVSQRSMDFANEQWRRQMEGLGRAQGSYDGSRALWDQTYGSQGTTDVEEWYKKYGSQYQDPTSSSGAFNDYKRWMTEGPNNTQIGLNSAMGLIGGPSNTSMAYDRMGRGLETYAGPQSTNTQWNMTAPQLNKTGAGEDWYSQNKDRYNRETNSELAYGQIAPQLYNDSASEQMFKEGHLGSTVAKQALAGHQNWAQGQTAHQKNEGENKGYIRGASQAGDYFQSQLPALANHGAYEQFVTADIAGANPLYERTRQRGMDSINQQMALRGNFNSGGALTALGNYTAELDAQDYQNRANRAQQAQQMQLARISQGGQLAQGAAGLDIQRGTSLSGLDTANESAQLGRQGFGLQAEKQASDEQNFGDRLRLDAAKQSDDAKLARLMGIGDLSKSSDASNLDLLTAGGKAANDAQEQMLKRLMAGMDGANMNDKTRMESDRLALDRMLASFNMGKGADDTALNRSRQIYDMNRGMDEMTLERFGMLGNMAGQNDKTKLDYLNSHRDSANDSTTAERNRTNDAFMAKFGMDDAIAKLFGQFYGKGGDLSGDATGMGLDALMQAYGYDAQAAGAPMEMLMSLFSQLQKNAAAGAGLAKGG